MGYRTSNAAYAYDMQPEPYGTYGAAPAVERPAAPAPASPVRRLDVVAGAGREANQAVSPLFTHCVKVFCILAVAVVALGLARVSIASATAGALNSAAELSGELEDARGQSSDLEVMRSVYGASTRIRDLAEGYGMVKAEENVVLDFTEYAPADGTQQ